MPCRHVSRMHLIDLLGCGLSLNQVAHQLGYRDGHGVTSAMRRFGIERTTTRDGVVVVIARAVA